MEINNYLCNLVHQNIYFKYQHFFAFTTVIIKVQKNTIFSKNLISRSENNI